MCVEGQAGKKKKKLDTVHTHHPTNDVQCTKSGFGFCINSILVVWVGANVGSLTQTSFKERVPRL